VYIKRDHFTLLYGTDASNALLHRTADIPLKKKSMLLFLVTFINKMTFTHKYDELLRFSVAGSVLSYMA
jgi:glutamine synthetase type III